MFDEKTRKIEPRFTDQIAIDEAMRLAFHDAVRRHRQGGVPMVFWKDGKVVEIPGEQIPLPEDQTPAPASK